VVPLAVTIVIAAIVPATIAGAATASAKPSPSRLYVGHSLGVGGRLTSTSGVYVARLVSGGRIEILKRGRAVWTSSAATGLDSVVTRESDGAIRLTTPRVAARVSGSAKTPGPSYLTVQNDGDLALVSTSGVPVWHGGLRANVTGSPVAPYTRGALFGGTNPSVLCYTCQAANITGSAPPSDTLDSGTDVNNMTGGFSTSNTLFDAPAIGGDLTLSLGYDAQLAQSQLTNGMSGGPFGEGWNSNFSSSVTTGSDPLSGMPSVTVNQGSGAEVTFTQSADNGTSTSCQSSGDPSGNQYPGDYPFTAKYTVSGSSENFCALDSVQGQLSEIGSTGFTYQRSGGQAIQDYGWTGQLEETTTATASSGTPALGLIFYSATAGTTSVGGVTLANACPTTASSGCTIIYTNDGRDIVEILTNLAQVGQVIDPSGNSYVLTYSSTTSAWNNLTSIAEPSPVGSATATWNYVYSSAASPYSSDLVQIDDPDYNASASTVAHTTTINYATSADPGMVSSLVDGTGATTTYSYAQPCATGLCAGAGASQTTTITYPGECPSSTAGCATTLPSTVTADIPREIDQYSNGLETSTQLGSQTNASESETWLYKWVLGNGVANTSEVITYPNTLAGSNPVARSATIVTDPAGNIVSTTNALGDVATSAYNETTSLNLPELTWSFPGPSSNSSSSPPAGASTYSYNGFGQVVTATDPLGNTTYYGYYSHYSLLCYQVSPILGAALHWTTATTPPSCSSTATTYDTGAVSAPVGSTTYSYDVQGDIVSSTVDAGDTGTSADPQTTTASYDAMGRVLWSIPPAGQAGAQSSSNPYATSTSYVAGTSLPATLYQPDGITTLYTYDAAGNVTSSGNRGVSTMWVYTTTLYDGDNRSCYQLQGSGSFGATCNASSQAGSTITAYVPGSTAISSVSDGRGNTTSYYYNDLAYPNSATEVQDPGSSEIQFSAYDDYGNACATGDVAPTLGSTQCTSPPSGDTATMYDALGNETSITDPNGNATANYYENSSYPTLVTRTVNAMGAVTKHLYNADGNVVTTVNPDGTGVTTNYDANERVCNKAPTIVPYACGQGPSTAGVTLYGYNNANELTTMSDNTGNPATPTLWSQTTTYGYAAGQLMSTTDGNAKTVTYSYNDAGQVACVGYPVSTTTNCGSPASSTNTIVTKSYDPLGRLSSTTDWLGNTVGYSYGDSWSPNSATTVTYPSVTGVTASYGIDGAGNVSSLAASSTVTSGTPISDTWSYNVDEQVSVSSINGATSGSQNYNANKQITQAANLATSTSNDNYTLALNGEITGDAAPSGATVASTYNGGDELCNTASTVVACGTTPTTGTKYVFTTNGQRSSSTPYTSGTASTATNYNWNAYGQLCSTGSSSTPTATTCGNLPTGGTSYQYNGNGLRMSATTATSTTASTWDSVSGGSIPLNINDATTTSSGTTNTSYLYGDLVFGGTAPVEQITTSSNAASVSYLVSNQTGVQGVYSGNTGSRGAVQEMAIYSVYGNQTLSSGSKVTPFGFQGSYTDPTGLIYLINRYYDPTTDQFLSIDPQVATTNQPFVFTDDDPLNSTDPLGLFCLFGHVSSKKNSPCRGSAEASAVVKVVKKVVKPVVQVAKPAVDAVVKSAVKVAKVTSCIAGSFWPTSPSLGAAGVTTGAGAMGAGGFLIAGSGVTTGVAAAGIATGGVVLVVAGAAAIGYGAYEYFKEC
jgi:RHS repeat-associated protein